MHHEIPNNSERGGPAPAACPLPIHFTQGNQTPRCRLAAASADSRGRWVGVAASRFPKRVSQPVNLSTQQPKGGGRRDRHPPPPIFFSRGQPLSDCRLPVLPSTPPSPQAPKPTTAATHTHTHTWRSRDGDQAGGRGSTQAEARQHNAQLLYLHTCLPTYLPTSLPTAP